MYKLVLWWMYSFIGSLHVIKIQNKLSHEGSDRSDVLYLMESLLIFCLHRNLDCTGIQIKL